MGPLPLLLSLSLLRRKSLKPRKRGGGDEGGEGAQTRGAQEAPRPLRQRSCRPQQAVQRPSSCDCTTGEKKGLLKKKGMTLVAFLV